MRSSVSGDSIKPDALKQKVGGLDWDGLQDLFERIHQPSIAREWGGSGNAFQYLIVRAFELSGADEVRYPYLVPFPHLVSAKGSVLEEVDGFVRIQHLSSLIESKDYSESVNVEPIAKMRNQLLRRPAGTIGTIFAREGFTDPAKILAGYLAPQAIILWDGQELADSLAARNLTKVMLAKYHHLQVHGHQDFDPGTIDRGEAS